MIKRKPIFIRKNKHILVLKIFQKETSDAVNSIMGMPNSVAEEVVRKIDNDDDLTNQSDYATTNIADLENIKGGPDGQDFEN